MENILHSWDLPTDYSLFFKEGITDLAIDNALRFARLKGCVVINQLINDKFYGGTEKHIYDMLRSIREYGTIPYEVSQRPLTYKDCYYGK